MYVCRSLHTCLREFALERLQERAYTNYAESGCKPIKIYIYMVVRGMCRYMLNNTLMVCLSCTCTPQVVRSRESDITQARL